MKKFEAACQDCRRALDMDQNLIKGHFFLGLSLTELHAFDEAIKHLQRGENIIRICKISWNSFVNQTFQLKISAKNKSWISATTSRHSFDWPDANAGRYKKRNELLKRLNCKHTWMVSSKTTWSESSKSWNLRRMSTKTRRRMRWQRSSRNV